MTEEQLRELEGLRAQNANLLAALFYTVSVLEAYDMEIRNSEQVVTGLDLVALGFCQGSIFQKKYDRLSQIYKGARDYPEGFDYGARLEGFLERDVKPDVGLFFAFGANDEGVMEGGALDLAGVYQTEAEARRVLEHPMLRVPYLAGHVAAFRGGTFEVVAFGRLGDGGEWEWTTEPRPGPFFAFGYKVYYPSGGARDLLGTFATEAQARARIVAPREDDGEYDAGHIARFAGGRMDIAAGAVRVKGGGWQWMEEEERGG